MNRSQTVFNFLVVITVIAAGVFLLVRQDRISNGNEANLPAEAPLDRSLSNTTFAFHYSSDWGLAVKPEQILATSYIPPCDEGFDYCFYYLGKEYEDTNFESAGIRIKERKDLTIQTACLNTLPEGRTGLAPEVISSDMVATSLFAPLGDAGLGHYANGELYRLSANGKCYEFETRIGETQFANYEPGAIKEFSAAERVALTSEIRRIIDSTTLPDGTPISFPYPNKN